MRVTLDSNVWEKTVSSQSSEKNKYSQLKKLIQIKKIQPYICEIAISLESITKKDRANFWKNYKPLIKYETLGGTQNIDGSTTISSRIMFGPDNDKHPTLHSNLTENLRLANKLGFKTLRMTNLGTVRTTQIPKKMLVPYEYKDDFWEYAEKLSVCANYITEIGCGSSKYHQFKGENGFQGSSIPRIMQVLNKSKEKQFAKSIAEWVDGDSIAAHYAYGNEIFCTEDKGKSAGNKSIFSPKNATKIKEKYGINILTINALLRKIL